MFKFIVAYSSSDCQILQLGLPHDDECLPLYEEYEEALARTEKTEKDVFGFNNRIWGLIEAETAYHALRKFMTRLVAEELSGNVIHPVE